MEPKINWNSACLIGLGNHSQKKLLPALDLIYGDKISIISRNPSKISSKYKHFYNLHESFKYLSKRTCYIIATPPKTHFSLAKKILESGRDVLVEKPSFFLVEELKILKQIAISKELVLAEMFMYLENESTKEIQKKIDRNLFNLNSIDITFTIPSIPKNTYRNEKSIENSVISDMGCYAFSLLANLNISMDNLDCKRFNNNNNFIFYKIFNKKNPSINISIGSTGIYQNFIRLNFKDKTGFEISPFFYGVEGYKKEISIHKDILNMKLIYDKNSFVKLFGKSRNNWIEDQEDRFCKMAKVIKIFEKFLYLF